MKIAEIIKIIKGRLIFGIIDDKEYYSFKNDSREVKSGDVFFALKTETNDGNKYVDSAIKNGAAVCIVSDTQYITNKKAVIIEVDDVLKSIQNLANYNRNKYDIPLICITGSVGKTTTKELVAKVLEPKYNVLYTEGNLNSDIGLPRTLLRLNKTHDIIVLEAGMNHLKEIELLSNIAEPNVGIITNIGTAHIGNLGSKAKIKEAKLEIISGFKQDATLYLNKDDDYLNKDIDYEKIVYYGMADDKLKPHNIISNHFQNKFDILYNNQKYNVEINVPGLHMINNSLLAIKIGLQYGVEMNDILEQLKKYKNIAKRLNIKNVKKATIIDDSYNASTKSMFSALDVLDLYKMKKIAVLADMLEMGKFSEEEHKKVGEYLKTKNIDIIITVGSAAKYYGGTIHFNNNEEVLNYIKENKFLNEDSVILFKGSNGMKLSEIINKLNN